MASDAPPSYLTGSAYHSRRRQLAIATQKCVELAVTHYGLPASVIDFGCGEGAHLPWLVDRNVRVMGLDLVIDPGCTSSFLQHMDLRVPIDCGVSAEWVFCWEVAEHLPEESAEILCDSLARHVARPNGRLFFTAASPGQRGPGHINCQPQGYWREKLAERGLTYQERETKTLKRTWREEVPRAPWYGNNLQILAWS